MPLDERLDKVKPNGLEEGSIVQLHKMDPLEGDVDNMYVLHHAHARSTYGLSRLLLPGHNIIAEMRCEGHSNDITCLTVLLDNTIVTGSKDKTIRVWERGCCTAVLVGHTSLISCLTGLTASSFVSGGYDYAIRLWHRSAKAEAGWECRLAAEDHTGYLTGLTTLRMPRQSSLEETQST